MKMIMCLAIPLLFLMSCSSSDVNEFKLDRAEDIAQAAEKASNSDFERYLEPSFVQSENCSLQASNAKVKIEDKLIDLFQAEKESNKKSAIVGSVCSSLAKIAIPYGVSKLEVSSCYKKLLEVRGLDLIAEKACKSIDL